jgi:hypothetical protein
MSLSTPEPLTEATIQRIAFDGQVLRSAQEVSRQFRWVGQSADGSWLMAEYLGSAPEPYHLDVDLDIPAKPIGNCSCPSQKQPCKHVIGLLLLFVRGGRSRFTVREPTPDMLRRRAERDAWKQQREQIIRIAPAGIRQVVVKKDQAQLDGLQLLQRLLLDLVISAAWSSDASRSRMLDVAAQLIDHYLPRVALLVQRLELLARKMKAGRSTTGPALLDLAGQLWALVRKLGKYLEGRQTEPPPPIDPILAEFLSDGLRMEDLRELGCIRTGLLLYEMAWERYDDEATGLRNEVSHLIDIGDNTLYHATTPRSIPTPKEAALQPSYREIVQPAETAIYPGWMTRRIRWEPTAEKVRPIRLGELGGIHDRVPRDFTPILEAFRQQCKDPLAPREATAILGCEFIGKRDDRLVLEDEKRNQVRVVDRPQGPLFPAVAALERAAGYLRYRPAVLVRLVLLPGHGKIVAQPLAIFNPSIHLRLSL